MNSKLSIITSLIEYLCGRRNVVHDRVSTYRTCKSLFEQNSNSMCVMMIYSEPTAESTGNGYVLEMWLINIDCVTECTPGDGTIKVERPNIKVERPNIKVERHDIKNHIPELDKFVLKMEPLLIGITTYDIRITLLLCSLDTLKCYIDCQYDNLFNMSVSKYNVGLSLIHGCPFTYDLITKVKQHNSVTVDTSLHIEENFFSHKQTVQSAPPTPPKSTLFKSGTSPLSSLFSRILGSSPIKEQMVTNVSMSLELKRFINKLDQYRFPID